MNMEALQSFFSEENNQVIDKPNKYTKEPTNLVLTRHIERDKQSQELYFKMAKNIKESERLRYKITKDIKTAVQKEDILLTALKCISHMIGDLTFYEQNIKELSKR